MKTKSLYHICADTASRTFSPWMIKGLMPPKGLVVLYGPTGVGKTFLLLDMVLTMAAGAPWPLQKGEQLEHARRRGETMGRISPPGHVLYWIGEGRENAEARVRAWVEEHISQDERAQELGQMSLSFVDDYITNLLLAGRGSPGRQPSNGLGNSEPLHNGDAPLHDWLEQLVAAFGDWHDPDPKAIRKTPVLVVDTLSATHPAMDENDTRDAGQVMENCRRLAERLNGLVILIHHSGKGRGLGPRGHSRMLGDPDTILNVSRPRLSETVIKLSVEKQRMSYPIPDMLFTLSQEQTGHPPVLHPYEGAVLEKKARLPKKLSKRQLNLLSVRDALEKFLPEGDPHFMKKDFVARVRHRWSEATVYSHLNTLQQYKVIFSDQPKGAAKEGQRGATLFALDASWTSERLAKEFEKENTQGGSNGQDSTATDTAAPLGSAPDPGSL